MPNSARISLRFSTLYLNLFVSIPFGLEVMCWGRVIYSLIATYLNTYYTNSLIDLTLKLQVKDVFPSNIRTPSS